MALPSPYNNAGLLMQGADQLGKGLLAAEEQRQLDMPGDPVWDAIINRLANGENPQKLAEEMRGNGTMDLLLRKAMNGGGGVPSPQGSVPDVGMQGGRPAVMPPGSVSPSGGPQGPAGQYGTAPTPQSMLAPGRYPGKSQFPGQAQAEQDVRGLMAQRKPMAPNRPAMPTMGDMQSTPSVGPRRPISGLQQLTAQGASPIQAPMGGMPQAEASGFGAPPQPQPPAAQPGRQPSQPTPATQPYRRTVREQQRWAGAMPTIIASESRESIQDQKTALSQRDQDLRGLIALMAQNGKDEDSIRKSVLGIEGMDVKQQIAVLKYLTQREVAEIGAGSKVRAAEAKGSGDRVKELRLATTALRQQIAGMSKSDVIIGPGGVQMSFNQANEALMRYEALLDAELGVSPRAPVEGPQLAPGAKPTQPQPRPQPRAAPAPATKSSSSSSGTVKMRFKGGQVRDVPVTDKQKAMDKYGAVEVK
jgi:hypothetical protein